MVKKENKPYIVGQFSYRTDIGKVRLNNEDQACAMMNANGDVLLLVCDGMGGSKKGDYASDLAKRTIVDAFCQTKKLKHLVLTTNWLKKTVRKANAAIYSEACSNEEYEGMGTTLTVALIIKGYLIVGQIGDSRLYSLKDNVFKQVTEDQTYAGYLLHTGQITEEEALVHPKRHILTNALGVYASCSMDVKIYPYTNQSLLLCSDGLYNNAPIDLVENIVKGKDKTEQKVNELIALANSYGGSDNIGVVLWEAQE